VSSLERIIRPQIQLVLVELHKTMMLFANHLIPIALIPIVQVEHVLLLKLLSLAISLETLA